MPVFGLRRLQMCNLQRFCVFFVRHVRLCQVILREGLVRAVLIVPELGVIFGKVYAGIYSLRMELE